MRVIETDQAIPENAITWLEHLEGIIKVTYFNGEYSEAEESHS